MNNIKVAIVGEIDWISYQMDISTIKNAGNNFKILNTDMIVSELGEILNTANRAHRDKEAGDCTVPNLIATYIFRSKLFDNFVIDQEKFYTLLYGCFLLDNADGKKKYALRFGGGITHQINDEDLKASFWTGVNKFQQNWLKDKFHPDSVITRTMKQYKDAVV